MCTTALKMLSVDVFSLKEFQRKINLKTFHSSLGACTGNFSLSLVSHHAAHVLVDQVVI